MNFTIFKKFFKLFNFSNYSFDSVKKCFLKFSDLKLSKKYFNHFVLIFFLVSLLFFGLHSYSNLIILTISSISLLYLLKYGKIKYNYIVFSLVVLFILKDFRLFLFSNILIGLGIFVSDVYIRKIKGENLNENNLNSNSNFQERLISSMMLVSFMFALLRAGGVILYSLSFLFGLFIFYEFLIMHIRHFILSNRLPIECFLTLHKDFRKTMFLGLIYSSLITVPLIFLISEGTIGSVKILFIFTIVASSDVGGYIFGKIIKGPKIIPTISPNKTYSGFVGCIVFGVVSAKYLFPILSYSLFGSSSQINSMNIVILISICILSQIGDVLESKIKRKCDIKDSGDLISGHGGLMDRFDSYALVLPFAALFL